MELNDYQQLKATVTRWINYVNIMEPLPYYLVLLTDMGENTYIRAITTVPNKFISASYPGATCTAWYGEDETVADYRLASGTTLHVRPVQDINFRAALPLTEEQAIQLKEV